MSGKTITLLADTIANCAKSYRRNFITSPQRLKNINVAELKYVPPYEGDVINFTGLRKPSMEKLKQIKTAEGLNEYTLNDTAGKTLDLGELDDACYITDNNSLFLERLIELFPKKAGTKVNTEVQKRMLYLQDIKHNNFTNKEEFLKKFIKDVEEVESLKALDGGLLYGDSVVSLYSKKAILQAKYNNPERYQELQDLLTLYKRGLVPRHNVATFFPEGHFNALVKSDMQKLLAGESYFPQFTKIDKSEILKLEQGEAFSVGEKMFVKTEQGFEKLNIDKAAYEKLFPPIERYSISQGYVGNCGKISSWNAMIKNPKSRVELYKMFEQTEHGIRVNIPRQGYTSEFQWNDLSSLYTDNNLQGGLGHKMLEYTYDINKHGSIDTWGNPRAEMIYNILGLSDERPREFAFVGNPDKLKEFCSHFTSGLFIKNEGTYNLNRGQTSEHFYSSTDLSKGIWQNPWTGVEELKIGYDSCGSGSFHVL